MNQLSLFDVHADGLTFSTPEEAEVYTSAYIEAWDGPRSFTAGEDDE